MLKTAAAAHSMRGMCHRNSVSAIEKRPYTVSFPAGLPDCRKKIFIADFLLSALEKSPRTSIFQGKFILKGICFMMRLFLRLFLSAVFMSAVLIVVGCSGSLFYENPANWVISDSSTPAYSVEYDMFFLYPSQVKKTAGETYNWMHKNHFEDTYHYVKKHTSDQVQQTARVFSPFVPQLGFDRYMELLKARQADPAKFDYSESPLAPAVNHTVMALKYYFQHYNPDARPFVLVGLGQGALILYEAMKECSRIKPKNGFVAAYLIGLPGLTAEQIRHDFRSRGILPASGQYDAGVIIVCNAHLPDQYNSRGFIRPSDYVINPLNWRTDSVPAGAALNLGAVFYARTARKASQKIRVIPKFCGAVLDTKHGGLVLTGIKPQNILQLSEFIYPSDIWGVFMRNIYANARERSVEFNFKRDLDSAQ